MPRNSSKHSLTKQNQRQQPSNNNLNENQQFQLQQLPQQQPQNQQPPVQTQEVLLKYLDEYRSQSDTKALREEGYEIDYDKLVGVGTNCAVFLAHPLNSSIPAPPIDKATGQRPIFTPGYDIAVKIIKLHEIVDHSSNKQTGLAGTMVPPGSQTKRNLKTRTGNLKLALALGQSSPENNILKVVDVFKTNERIFIFTQYCAYGSIISFIRRNGQVPAKLAQKWSAQTAAALCYLHRFHISHRNYKLENVLVDEKLDAKLTGFGLSKLCIDFNTRQVLLSKSICGSEPYLAPEMLREVSERNYDPRQADVWAYGVGVFLLATRKYPFEADNLRALRLEQLAAKYMEKDTKRRIKRPVYELIQWCFIIDPNIRPTMQDIVASSSYLNIKPKKQISNQDVTANALAVAAAAGHQQSNTSRPFSTNLGNQRSNKSTLKPTVRSKIDTKQVNNQLNKQMKR